MRKMTFMNKLMFTREICKCRDILEAEDKEGEKGLLAEVRQYCEEYKLPDVMKIRKNDLKRQVNTLATRKS